MRVLGGTPDVGLSLAEGTCYSLSLSPSKMSEEMAKAVRSQTLLSPLLSFERKYYPISGAHPARARVSRMKRAGHLIFVVRSASPVGLPLPHQRRQKRASAAKTANFQPITHPGKTTNPVVRGQAATAAVGGGTAAAAAAAIGSYELSRAGRLGQSK